MPQVQGFEPALGEEIRSHVLNTYKNHNNSLDRLIAGVRKIIRESGGKQPLSFKSVMYLPRDKGGCGLRSWAEI